MWLLALNIMEKVPELPEVPQVDFAQPTWDLFIYLFFAVAVVLFGMTLGRRRVVSVLLSVYLSLVVIDALPYLNTVLGDVNINLGIFAFKVSSFAIVFILAFLILSRSTVLYEMGGGGRGIISAFVFSFLFVGLLMSIVLGFLPTDSWQFVSSFTREIFISDLAKFIWIVLPIVAMAFLQGKEE